MDLKFNLIFFLSCFVDCYGMEYYIYQNSKTIAKMLCNDDSHATFYKYYKYRLDFYSNRDFEWNNIFPFISNKYGKNHLNYK